MGLGSSIAGAKNSTASFRLDGLSFGYRLAEASRLLDPAFNVLQVASDLNLSGFTKFFSVADLDFPANDHPHIYAQFLWIS